MTLKDIGGNIHNIDKQNFAFSVAIPVRSSHDFLKRKPGFCWVKQFDHYYYKITTPF